MDFQIDYEQRGSKIAIVIHALRHNGAIIIPQLLTTAYAMVEVAHVTESGLIVEPADPNVPVLEQQFVTGREGLATALEGLFSRHDSEGAKKNAGAFIKGLAHEHPDLGLDDSRGPTGQYL